jgi:flavin-dependent dehydrogenase
MTEDPINIIGAGPAGLTAAIVLRKHGFPVRVYEKSSDVGHRLNGDFQGLENWSAGRDIRDLLRDIGIEINFLCVPCYGGTVYAPDMDPAEVKSETPLFYLVKRGYMHGTLDTGLKEQALSSGVEILFDRRLDTFDEPAIVATGPERADAVIVGMTFRTESKDTVAVIFHDDIGPKGYAYLMINQGYGTMATVLYREFKRGNECFGKMMRHFRELEKIDIRNGKKFGAYGNCFLRDTQVHNNKLYVGEAAGFQDGLWGFGMRYAIVSGYLAAQSLINGSDYDGLWKNELKPMVETSIVNRYLFEKFGHAGYRYITRKVSEGHPCDFLRRQYNPSPLKHMLLPVAIGNYKSRIKNESRSNKDYTRGWQRS